MRRRPCRLILPHYGKIIRDLPIEQCQLAQLVAPQLSQAGSLRRSRQRRQPLPVRPPLLNPLVRDHEIR